MKFKGACLIILLFVSFATKSIAQDTLNSAIVEQKTYQLYLDKNWSGLIKYGNNAVHNGYNYFYLQLRIGIAYFEKKNYSLAEGYFREALKFNSEDELTLEYLYYCYIYMGRNEDARLLSKRFSNSLSVKTGTDKQSSVGFIMIEGGTKITDSISYYDVSRKTSSNYFNPAFYLQFGLNHYIKNRASVFHALTYFNQQSFISRISQSQYYMKVAVPIKHNWLITPAVHFIHIKNTYDIKAPPPPIHNGQPPKPQIFIIETRSNYFVGSLAIQKVINKFTLSLGTTVSNMSNVTQYIHSGFISYSVMGNSKFVMGCTGYVHTSDSYSSSNLALAPFIYIQPVKQLSLKLSYLYNSKNNFIEDNGYLVNNSADLTKTRYSALLNLSISKHVALYGLYQLEYKYEAMQHFNYRYNVLVGGIKITP